MSYTNFVSLLVALWFAFIVFLLWVNYKARFRYKMWEGNPIQRWIQKRIGVMALCVTLLIGLVEIWLAPYGIAWALNIPYGFAFVSVVSGLLGLAFFNSFADTLSVRAFEKNCLKCENKKDCSKFLNEKCSLEFLRHNIRMAVEYDRKAES